MKDSQLANGEEEEELDETYDPGEHATNHHLALAYLPAIEGLEVGHQSLLLGGVVDLEEADAGGEVD